MQKASIKTTELATNIFRATQTEEKLRNENLKGKKQITPHYQVDEKYANPQEIDNETMPPKTYS